MAFILYEFSREKTAVYKCILSKFQLSSFIYIAIGFTLIVFWK